MRGRGRIPRWLASLGWHSPRAVLAVWSVLVLGSLAGVVQLRVETSTTSVLSKNDPEWAFYQETQERFGGDEFVAVVIESATPLSTESLEAVRDLSSAFSSLDGVRRVDSLATVPLIESSGGSISLAPALALGEQIPAPDELMRRLKDDWSSRGTLVSADGQSLALNLLLEADADGRYQEILENIDQVLGGRKALVTGVPVFRVAADVRTRGELLLFVPATIVLIGILLFVFFGSIRAVAIPLICSAIGVLVVLGGMGFSEVPLTIGTLVLPSVLIALGCAYGMHMLTASAQASSEPERLSGILDVALPLSLSGLTTAVGFVAISFVQIDVVRQLGAYGALGVMIVLASSLTAGPALLRAFPVEPRRREIFRFVGPQLSSGLLHIATRRPGIVVGLWVCGALVVGSGIPRVEVETDVILWFAEDDEVRMAYNGVRDVLSGISPMSIVIEAPGSESSVAPEALHAQRELSAFLEAMPEVGRAVSIADPLAQLHRQFSGVDEPLPTRSDLIEQLMLLLESKGRVEDFVTADRSAARVILRAYDNGSRSLLAVARRASEWWAEHGVDGYEMRPTGIMYEFARSEEQIAWGQIKGLSFAVIVIGGVLLAMFRSPMIAMMALLPNAIPVLFVFGLMGFFGIPLDAGTVAVGNLALGIAVDDTVHIVEGFQRRRGGGVAASVALRATLLSVLPAIVLTTIIVSVGFLVLASSGFVFVRNLGALTSVIMVLCLLADTTLLPALLVKGVGGSSRDRDILP